MRFTIPVIATALTYLRVRKAGLGKKGTMAHPELSSSILKPQMSDVSRSGTVFKGKFVSFSLKTYNTDKFQ
jgi:hypothetical protein